MNHRRRPGIRIAAISVGVVLVVIAIVVSVTLLTSTDEPEVTQPNPLSSTVDTPAAPVETGPLYPVDGLYRIKVMHSALCMGVGPERGNEQRTVLVQQPCDAAWPDLAITEIKDGLFRFVLKYADHDWEDCVGADEPGTVAGNLIAGYDCVETDELQTFQLSRVEDSDAYQIHLPAGSLCLGVKQESAIRGTAVEATACDPNLRSQQFKFIPR